MPDSVVPAHDKAPTGSYSSVYCMQKGRMHRVNYRGGHLDTIDLLTSDQSEAGMRWQRVWRVGKELPEWFTGIIHTADALQSQQAILAGRTFEKRDVPNPPGRVMERQAQTSCAHARPENPPPERHPTGR